MNEAISEAERDAFAREAFAAIESVIDRRCPETRGAFWAAVELLYRRDPPYGRQPGGTAGPDLEARPLRQPG